jgi:hypothetical protein
VGRALGHPYQPPERPEGKINITDPDSRNVKTNLLKLWRHTAAPLPA